MITFDNSALAWTMVRGGGKTQNSASSVSIPPEVLSRYNAVNSQAQTVAQTPFQQYSTDPNAFVAPLDATQNAGIVGTNDYSSTAQPFYQQGENTAGQGIGSLGSATGLAGNAASLTNAGSGAANAQQLTPDYINQFENPFAQDVIQPTSQLMEQQFNQAQSGQLGNAINNGAFGGDRAAITAANLQQQQGLAYGQTIGGLEGQMYNTALNTAGQQQGVNLGAQQANLARLQQGGQGLNTIAGTEAGIGAGYGNLGTTQGNLGAGAQAAGLSGAQAQLTAGQAQQQTEQAGLTGLYNQFLQQQSYPFQTTQFETNVAEGTGALSGSNSSATSPAPFFSDERLKTDIEPIGKTFDGQSIIRFRYKDEPHKRIGLIAQDVERKHPHAVGLAGGYKTVDYDAATSDAAAAGRTRKASGGGLVPDTLDRRAYAYGGLSPNAAWDAGFYVDPSYLAAQEQAYASAPWGNAGPVGGSAPYGGRSHVPPSTGSGVHGALAVAKLPAPSNTNTLRQVSQGLGDVEKLGQEGKGLYDGAQGALKGLAPASPAAAAPAATETAPAAAMGGDAMASSAIPPTSDGLAALGSAGTDAQAELGDAIMGDAFARRGGLMRDGGGFVDASTDDQSAGGDIPYDSGTGSRGMDIPDDRNTRSLQVAQPLSGSSSSGAGGLGNVASDAGDALKLATMIIPFLSRGGLVPRKPRAEGGDTTLPDDADDAMNGHGHNSGDGVLAGGPLPGVGSGVVRNIPDQSGNNNGAGASAGNAGLAGASGNDLYVNKGSRSADLPTRDARPVQAVAPMPDGSGAQPAGGLGGALGGVGDFINNNQGWLVPLAHGVGTMASSNSRYLGSAILQGLGGAADSYENVQNEMQARGLNAPVVQERQQSAFADLQNRWMEFNAKNGTNIPFNDFVNMMKGTGAAPQLKGQNFNNVPTSAQSPQVGAQGGSGSSPVAQSRSYSVQELQTGINPATGIPYRNDPAYLQAFAQKNGSFGGYLGSQAQIAAARAAEINGQGFTYDAKGNQTLIQGSPNVAQQKGNIATNVGLNNDFQNEAAQFNKSYQPTQHLLTDLEQTYATFRSGSEADKRAAINALAMEVDPSGALASKAFSGAYSGYSNAMKTVAASVAAQLAQTGGRAPAAEMGMFEHFAGNPDLEAGALRNLVIRGRANLQFQHDLYSGYDPTEPGNNPIKYVNQFNNTKNYDRDYVTPMARSVPAFAGQIPQDAPGDQRARRPGEIYKTPDGKPHLWMYDHWENQ